MDPFIIWMKFRRLIGVLGLTAGIWAVWFALQFQIAGREINGIDWYRFSLNFINPVGLWLLLSFVSKLGMIFNIRRLSLSGVATFWFFLFTYVMFFIPRVMEQLPPPSTPPFPTIPIGSIDFQPIEILSLWWPVLDFFDVLFSWLGPKVFYETEKSKG